MAEPALTIQRHTTGTSTPPESPAACRVPAAGGQATGRRSSLAKTAGVGALLGIACLVCLVPSLAIGGAGLFAAGAIGADQLIMAAGAIALATYGVYTVIRRRRATTEHSGCGC